MGQTKSKQSDDNNEIIHRLQQCRVYDILPAINERLDIGRERYGHGVIIDSDTTQFGTKKDDWLEMAHEEFYDGIIYLTAEEIRRERNNEHSEKLTNIRNARTLLINAIRMLEKGNTDSD
tara:strand:+ start:405 stop:764 length:360 start_codon:yes stop_codon:yes gene_type:complete